jgi:exodeoxyribonuclease VII large subunit
VVSAIGHEPDTPLVDHVADLRASTPTDAAKRIVPDIAEELHRISVLRERARRCLHGWVDRERRLLDALRSRPVLADPVGPINRRVEEIERGRDRARRAMLARLNTEQTALTATRSRLTTLGPAATLARGYAILQVLDDPVDTGDDMPEPIRATTEPGPSPLVDGAPVTDVDAGAPPRAQHVVRSIDELGPGRRIRVRVVDGAGFATVTSVESDGGS